MTIQEVFEKKIADLLWASLPHERFDDAGRRCDRVLLPTGSKTKVGLAATVKRIVDEYYEAEFQLTRNRDAIAQVLGQVNHFMQSWGDLLADPNRDEPVSGSALVDWMAEWARDTGKVLNR